LAAELTALALAFAFGAVVELQARLNPKIEQTKTNKNFFNIKNPHWLKIKIAVPA